jgi:predicted DNA-binding transcriptional regulator AlpA
MWLEAKDVARLLGYEGSHPYQFIDRRIRNHQFPQPERVEKRLQWRERDVLAWREARAERVLGGVK